jgi:YegS/Rv2252/BmrU family lipid kinase
MKRITFIVNPISGTDDKNTILSLLDRQLAGRDMLWEVIYTDRAGHAVEIAAEKSKEKVDAVVAVGGDGTINEVARSLVHTDTILGIIPCGSGNGLARHLQIPMDTATAVDIICEGLTQVIDYGTINGQSFFGTCGVGFDALISEKFAEAGKRGMLTYIEKMLQESLKYKPKTYKLETEEGIFTHKAFLVACGNASQYGNDAFIAPQATLIDGLMDVIILEPFTVLDIPSLAIQLFNKTIDQNSRIKSFRCKKLIIHREKEGVVHFDGEPMTTGKDVTVEIIRKGLHVFVPSDGNKAASNVLVKAQVFLSNSEERLKKLTRKE